MNYTERAISFDSGPQNLFGILAAPERANSVGVIVIVGGPQYRAGSHRQFVLLSRSLASAGFAVLRFDYSGMGDSTGAPRGFLQVEADVAAAIDAMQKELACVQQIAFWGLCDGASAALLYCHDAGDARVTGLCLLNPWVRSEASLARTHVKHYYWRRLRQKEFWVKLLSGKVAMAALIGLWKNLLLMSQGARTSARHPARPFQHRMASSWRKFHGQILLLLSGDDYTAKEFLEHAATDGAWAGLLDDEKRVTRHALPAADHTFSDAASRLQAENLTLGWLRAFPSNETKCRKAQEPGAGMACR